MATLQMCELSWDCLFKVFFLTSVPAFLHPYGGGMCGNRDLQSGSVWLSCISADDTFQQLSAIKTRCRAEQLCHFMQHSCMNVCMSTAFADCSWNCLTKGIKNNDAFFLPTNTQLMWHRLLWVLVNLKPTKDSVLSMYIYLSPSI